jgi:FtsZ-interacting cell division protein YlmF
MNEAVLRSPKWLRNFVDFEVSTGEDIKGEPSKKMKQKEEERKKIEAEERERREKEERERREKEEKEKAETRKNEKEQEFDDLLKEIVTYIYSNYTKCNVNVPKHNFLTIEKDRLTYDNKKLRFKITLDNTISHPTFDVYVKWGNEVYDYKISGVIYTSVKNFFVTTLYDYYIGNTSNKQSNQQQSYKQADSQESDSIKNKRRRFDLLKNTLDGYERECQISKIGKKGILVKNIPIRIWFKIK